MDLKQNRIPNKMLKGTEVARIAVKSFEDQLARDCYFNDNIAYPRFAMTIEATFHFGYPVGDITVKVPVRPNPEIGLTGEVPLPEATEEDELLSLKRDVDVDNPNVARIEHGLPIVIESQQPPRPIINENAMVMEEQPPPNPFPEVQRTELKYDSTQFPKGPAPTDVDLSEKVAAKFGIPPKKRR